MMSKTQQKRIDSEFKRKQRYDKCISDVKELTMKATGKKGFISFYKNCTWVMSPVPGNYITWDHYYCDREPIKLFNYFTKGRLRLLEMYMPNYYDFINKHSILCFELLKETDNMFGHGHRDIVKNIDIPPRERREGQHYYNGSLFYLIQTLKRQLVLLETEKSKYLHKIFLLKTQFPIDIVNNVQSFISSAYSA
jgi:hypothetical protein